MGLLQQCPRCKRRVSLERWIEVEEKGEVGKRKEKITECECGFKLASSNEKLFWIDFYDQDGRRHRKKIGPQKNIAQLALKDIAVKIARGEYLGIYDQKKVSFKDFVNPKFVEKIIGEHVNLKINHRLLIWSFLSFEWWCKIFLDGYNIDTTN